MTCERYWRDGIVLAERGHPDPHRETCEDCRRAHRARGELVNAVSLIGHQTTGDPHWQARVWSRIESERPRMVVRCWAFGALAAACATTLLWFLVRDGGDAGDRAGETALIASATPVGQDVPAVAGGAQDALPWIEIISGPVAMRSTSARVGDRVRISARSDDEIRMYRAEKLMLRCGAPLPAPGCARTGHGLVLETSLETAGEYQLVVIKSGSVEPVGALATDLAAVVTAGGDYQLTDLSIR